MVSILIVVYVYVEEFKMEGVNEMAVVKQKREVKAVAIFMNGLGVEGEPILKSKIIASVNPKATDQQVFTLVETIAGLQDLTIVEIQTREYHGLLQN